MRTLAFFGVLAAICWSAQVASAQNYRDTTGDTINPEKAINQSRYNTHIQLGREDVVPLRSYRARSYAPGVVVAPNMSAAANRMPAVGSSGQAGQQNRGDQWRYRRFNNQWWYYQTNNKWVVWNGKSWTEPMAHAGATQSQTGSHQ